MKYVAKDDVPNYPLLKYCANAIVVDDVQKVSSCCKQILNCSVIGFDTETKPAFQKGVSYNISLLQLSANDQVFLFRIDKIGFHNAIIDILENPDIVKVGIDLKNDLVGLKKIQKFEERNFIDLNALAINKGYKSIGAVKLCIMLLGYRISKKQRLSDWSVNKLSDAQIEYAAIDAWICPKILNSFKAKLLYP